MTINRLLSPTGWVNLNEEKVNGYTKEKNVYSYLTHDEHGDGGKVTPKSDSHFVNNNKPVHSYHDSDGALNTIHHHPKGHTLHTIHDEMAGQQISRFKGHHDPKKMQKAIQDYAS